VSSTPATGNRLGTWAVVLGILGMVWLVVPAPDNRVVTTVLVLAGAAISLTSVILGARGIRAARAGRAATQHTAVVGIALGAIASLFWVTAVLGLVLGL